ncbi:acyloxyacyl hydrolase [Azospirillum halopraeferens]|uniref:acyloxyacyl hydrolase n=1 Tax=Azospirillum halopraeferens TaxID=34010 RepID=UPI00041494E7|nr:acyloxyacyl hydrolase [Azospirillum halopraeferens]
MERIAKGMAIAGLAVAAAAFPVAAAKADSARAHGLPGWELRLGASAHDIEHDHDGSETLDLTLEVLTAPIPIWEFETKLLHVLANPRGMIGGSLNTEGHTNYVYAGLAWTYPFESGFYITPSFGLALHDGNLKRESRPCTAAEMSAGCGSREPYGAVYTNTHEEALGTSWLFREAIEIGYAFDNRFTVGVYYAHMSNANIGNEGNGGMNIAGARLGYLFN